MSNSSQNNELENNELTGSHDENSEEILNMENKKVSATSEFSEQAETKNSVKRLSLFDLMDDKSTNEKSDIENIKNLYAHPQSLAQCQNYIKLNLPEAILLPVISNSEGAKMIVNRDEGCIGSKKLSTTP